MAAITPIEAGAPDLQRRITTFVRVFMARDGLSQHDLAERLQVDHTTIGARLRRTRKWSAEDVEALALIFDEHPGVFYGDPKGLRPTLRAAPPRPEPAEEQGPPTKWYSPPSRAA